MGVMGRPKFPWDWEKYDNICKHGLFKRDVAELMGCSEDLIDIKMKELGTVFSAYRDQKMAHTRFSLIQKAIRMALAGNNNTMMIFCLKNLCRWSDAGQLDEDIKDLKIVVNAD